MLKKMLGKKNSLSSSSSSSSSEDDEQKRKKSSLAGLKAIINGSPKERSPSVVSKGVRSRRSSSEESDRRLSVQMVQNRLTIIHEKRD